MLHYADINYKYRLLQLNMLPLTMRREYEDIVFFWKCLDGMYDINVLDFVKFFSDSQHVTRSSNDSGFLMISSICRTDCFQRRFLIELFKFGTLCYRVYT